ncbi:hypothetical protein ECZU23_48500 [Escherichia coli]|nr:hypothetical protein ECZU11_20760 [Escherichia coli]GHK96034.1 hypothetical protein ECZU20_07840 [Escherichia coli]GHL16407.1 hypothetical protein ECZU23_48500 [Escherichia coli]GHL57595.1 hypothetical protein ECZU31_08700 [Escherichia coli]
MPALNSGHTVSKISHPQLVRTFCHELTVYAVTCGNGFPADGSADLLPQRTPTSPITAMRRAQCIWPL